MHVTRAVLPLMRKQRSGHVEKYRRYGSSTVGTMVSAEVVKSTLRLVPS